MTEKDVFQRQDALLKRVKNLGVDVFGNPKVKLPCDNMTTFKIEDCVNCLDKTKCEVEK
jgi:hypothetical protein